jgi:hypothetical protein
MSQTPQPPQSAQPQPPRPRKRRRKPWYRKPKIMGPLAVATLIGVLGIIFNFPRIQHLIGLDNPNTAPTPTPAIPTATAFPKTSPLDIPLQLISQPNYANVGGTLVSVTLSGQIIELRLSFVHNGKAACIGVKFHTLDLHLIKSSEPPLKPTSSIDQSWTLSPGVPESQSVQFQIPPGAESQYNLTLLLDVGGCATPHDSSPNRYANYKVEFPVTE